jgi:hypothetical protein
LALIFGFIDIAGAVAGSSAGVGVGTGTVFDSDSGSNDADVDSIIPVLALITIFFIMVLSKFISF